MADREHREKEEEKREEKEEKNWDEKFRRDPVSAVVWAGILIWAGVVLLASNLGLLVRFEWLEEWSLILLGAGLLVLLEAAVRLLVPEYRRPVMGTIILGVILVAIALGSLVSWNLIWPLALIALGLLIGLRVLFRR